MVHITRYFKLMYIAAGILMSNPEICETLDEIKISPNVQIRRQKDGDPAKRIVEPKNSKIHKKTTKGLTELCQLQKYKLRYLIDGIKESLETTKHHLNIVFLLNLSLDFLIRMIYNKFMMSSDCDLIYK